MNEGNQNKDMVTFDFGSCHLNVANHSSPNSAFTVHMYPLTKNDFDLISDGQPIFKGIEFCTAIKIIYDINQQTFYRIFEDSSAYALYDAKDDFDIKNHKNMIVLTVSGDDTYNDFVREDFEYTVTLLTMKQLIELYNHALTDGSVDAKIFLVLAHAWGYYDSLSGDADSGYDVCRILPLWMM